MDRRKFLTGSISTAIAAGALLNSSDYNKLFAASTKYDLVAIKGGEPDAMFDKAITELGGMKNFVKKNQTVVIKPNIGWDVPPERAGNTNPKLISRIVQQCYAAGAKKVYVFDHTCDNWKKTYKTSLIEKAVTDAGGTIVSGESETYYHDVEVKSGKKLQSAKVHELILDSDVFINIPILKHHSSAKLTVSMKNLMGIVYDRSFWHRNDLHQYIADFASWRKPDLNIVDAYYVMKQNGPKGKSPDDVIMMKTQLISTDMVAIDAAAAKLFGSNPEDIPYITYAANMKLGRMDLEHLNIKRMKM